jgi:hypothetical protein
MELNESRNIVKTLATGVDPTTGEVFPPESPYNDPKVIRALFSILEFVKHAKKPRKTLEERRQENIECGRPRNAGLPWTEDDRAGVVAQFKRGATIQELARAHDRSCGAIQAELVKQGLVSPDLP